MSKVPPKAAPAASPTWLRVKGDDLLVDVLVVPKASRSRIMGVHDHRLKIQLTDPPVDGRANEGLVRFIADALGVPKVQVEVVTGASSRRKTVCVVGVPQHLVILRLGVAV